MVAVITGTSSGIGLEICKELLANGYKVFALSRKIGGLADVLTNKDGEQLIHIKVDLSVSSEVHEAVKVIKTSVKEINLLINNAGFLLNKPILETNVDDIEAMFGINFRAPIQLIQLLFPLLDNNSSSQIINIGSMGGCQGSAKFSGLSVYSSSKAALACFTECLAEELKDTNIIANCLALGAVQTEMLSKAFPGYKAPVSAVQMAEFIVSFVLLGQPVINGKVVPVSLNTP